MKRNLKWKKNALYNIFYMEVCQKDGFNFSQGNGRKKEDMNKGEKQKKEDGRQGMRVKFSFLAKSSQCFQSHRNV